MLWRLVVEAEIPGVDYPAIFEVPAFRTEKSSKDYVHDDDDIGTLRGPLDLMARLQQAGIRTELPPAGANEGDFTAAKGLPDLDTADGLARDIEPIVRA